MTNIPNELYEIRLYNHSGVLIDILRGWDRLEYHQRINSPWNHQITFNMSYDDPRRLNLRAIKKDYFILIYRTDPVTLERDLVYEGFNQTVVDQARANGDLIFNLYGVGYTQLLTRRVVIPPVSYENNAKTGKSESCMKGYVSDSMVTCAADRKVPGMVVEADSAAGVSEEYTARYVLLSTVVENLSESGDLDFGIEGSDPPGNFIFRARPVWGLDRTVTNTVGNTPMIFDLRYNNMDIPIFSTNASEEKNFVYVGGQGQGVEREILELSNLEAILESPWGRKEAYTDARHEDDTAGLVTTGKAYLKKNALVHKLSFNVRQTFGTRWLRDWGLGDLITARYSSYQADLQIDEVRVVVSSMAGADTYELVEAEMVNA